MAQWWDEDYPKIDETNATININPQPLVYNCVHVVVVHMARYRWFQWLLLLAGDPIGRSRHHCAEL